MEIEKYEALKKIEKIVDSCNYIDQLENCINWILNLQNYQEYHNIFLDIIKKKREEISNETKI